MTTAKDESAEQRVARLQRMRDWRANNPDQRIRGWERREKLRTIVRSYKDRPCTDCGGRFHYAAMQFDHRPGETKVCDINRMVSRLVGLAVIQQEMAKCDLVCANCHAIRTWDRSRAVA